MEVKHVFSWPLHIMPGLTDECDEHMAGKDLDVSCESGPEEAGRAAANDWDDENEAMVEHRVSGYLCVCVHV